jgi:hypothetical protein
MHVVFVGFITILLFVHHMLIEFRSSFKVASISNIFLPLMLKVYIKKCKILFFNSYILPIFDFCCTVWWDCSEEGIQRITKLQKRAARIILDAPFFTPTQHLFLCNK